MLTDFANHTRQSDAERADLTSLCKKYLAVHCNLAPMPLVYAQIASDYKLLELRTHNPPIHHYARYNAFDPDTFVTIMRDGYAHCKGPIDTTKRPCLSYFIDSLFPKAVGQEAWEAWHNDGETWKQRAYFMALNCNEHADFYQIVSKVFSPHSGGDKDAIDDLYTRLNVFKATMPACSAEEMGSIIKDLKMPETIDCCGAQEKKEKEKKKEDEAIVEASLILSDIAQQPKLQFVAAPPPPPEGGGGGVVEPIQTYRKRLGLNVTFPPLRLAKQVLLSAMGFKGTERAEFEAVRGRDQSEFMPYDKIQDGAVLESALSSVIDHSKLTALLNEHGADDCALKAAPLATGGAIEPVAFMREMIGMYASSGEITDRRVRAYLKQWPKPCDALINVVLNL
jgi:hypothetical protein